MSNIFSAMAANVASLWCHFCFVSLQIRLISGGLSGGRLPERRSNASISNFLPSAFSFLFFQEDSTEDAALLTRSPEGAVEACNSFQLKDLCSAAQKMGD